VVGLLAVITIAACISGHNALKRKFKAKQLTACLESMEPSEVEVGMTVDHALALQLINIREAAAVQKMQGIEALALSKLQECIQRCQGRHDWAALHAIEKELSATSWGEAASHAAHVLNSVKLWSNSLGIGLKYALDDLTADFNRRNNLVEWRKPDKDAVVWDGLVQKCRWSQEDPTSLWTAAHVVHPPTNPTFSQMAPVLAYGQHAIGLKHTCPRDGMQHASIVDALHTSGKSNPANYFLSWAWAFDLEVVLSSLRCWARSQAFANPSFDAGSVFIWWCFFVNNQFRILDATDVQNTEELAGIFGGKLRDIGKMLLLLGTGADSLYLKRTWCIFECFVATSNDIPSTILLAESVSTVCGDATLVDELVDACIVDAKESKASSPQDEQQIKQLILREHGSFAAVNDAVQLSLSKQILATRYWARKDTCGGLDHQ